MQEKAKQILHSLENDKNLVSPDIEEFWKGYLKRHTFRYLDLLSFLKDTGKTILEIGSFPAHALIMLKLLGYRVRGVDIDPSRFRGLLDKYDIQVDKLDVERENLPFPSDSFDIVLFTELIEHLRFNPLSVLRETYRVLKTGGRIIISTPNITPLQRIAFLFGKDYQGSPLEEFKKLEWLGHMGHIRIYSLKEIKEMLEYTGYEVCSYACKGESPEGWKAKIIKMFYPKKEHFNKILYVVARKPK